jgi:uncharacterized membrane protein YbhN (UPF0104 family)
MRGSQAVRVAARPESVLTACLIMAAGLAAWTIVSEDRADSTAAALSRVPWPAISAMLLLPLVVAIHYISAALALRAVSDQRLALRPTTFAQFAAGAVNRMVPNGLGGALVNLRYLLRVGLTPGVAASAVAAIGVVGAATDALCVGAITAVGPAIGLGGAARELHALTTDGLQAGQRNPWVLVAAVAVLATAVLLRSRGAMAAGIARGTRHAVAHMRDLAARPSRVIAAIAASMTTTMAMSVGFVAVVDVWGHAATPLPAGALVAIYLVAAAAGGATPLPPFFGVTEAMLIGGLVLAGYSSGSALLSVIIFRAVTYWLPLPVGLWAARRLRRANLL